MARLADIPEPTRSHVANLPARPMTARLDGGARPAEARMDASPPPSRRGDRPSLSAPTTTA